jgi:hypothetical protein
LAGLTTAAFVDLVVFVAGFVTASAALPAGDLVGDLVGVIPLATVADLAALLGGAALTNFPVFGGAGFAIRATFSAFLPVASTGIADVLARVVAAGVVSHRVACFAATRVAFGAAFTFAAVFTVSERFTAGSAG